MRPQPVGLTKTSLPTNSPCNYETKQKSLTPSELELSPFSTLPLPPPPASCGLKRCGNILEGFSTHEFNHKSQPGERVIRERRLMHELYTRCVTVVRLSIVPRAAFPLLLWQVCRVPFGQILKESLCGGNFKIGVFYLLSCTNECVRSGSGRLLQSSGGEMAVMHVIPFQSQVLSDS